MVKMAYAKPTLSVCLTGAAALVGELQKRCNALQEDSKATKVSCATLSMEIRTSHWASSSSCCVCVCAQEKLDGVESQLEQQSETLNQRLETLQQQQQSQADEFTNKLGEIVERLEQFSGQLKNLEVSLT